MKLFHCKDILAHLAIFWQGFLTQRPLSSTAYDRLLAAIDNHSLDDALSILENIGCHDPLAQVALLAACQKSREVVCDA